MEFEFATREEASVAAAARIRDARAHRLATRNRELQLLALAVHAALDERHRVAFRVSAWLNLLRWVLIKRVVGSAMRT